jgi:hypothetical protein
LLTIVCLIANHFTKRCLFDRASERDHPFRRLIGQGCPQKSSLARSQYVGANLLQVSETHTNRIALKWLARECLLEKLLM